MSRSEELLELALGIMAEQEDTSADIRTRKQKSRGEILTVRQLTKSTLDFELDTRAKAQRTKKGQKSVRVTKVNMDVVINIPKQGNMVQFYYNTKPNPEAPKPTTWLGFQQFFPVQTLPKPQKGYKRVQMGSGDTVYVRPFTDNMEVICWCTCPDFRHRFHWWLEQTGNYSGRLIPYKRKTTTYPEVNPNHIPGLCKHQHAVFRRIAKNGWIVKPAKLSGIRRGDPLAKGPFFQ